MFKHSNLPQNTAISHKEFLRRLKIKVPNYKSIYDIIGIYKSTYTKLEVRTKYGNCMIIPKNMSFGFPPTIETAIDKTSYFIKKAEELHGKLYDYSLVKYIGSKQKVIIICPIHGEFTIIPNHHLLAYGCQKCSTTSWKKGCARTGTPVLYIIRCFNKNEEFIKIGITSGNISKRFNSKATMPYSYEVLKEIKGSPDFIWDKEKELHKKFREYSYIPKTKFAGQTECFKITKQLLNKML